jgi:hypothetical protein
MQRIEARLKAFRNIACIFLLTRFYMCVQCKTMPYRFTAVKKTRNQECEILSLSDKHSGDELNE